MARMSTGHSHKTIRGVARGGPMSVLRPKCTKIDFGWGSAPDPAGGAYSASPDTLAVFKGGATSNGRKGVEGKGEGGEGKERERGKGKGGRGTPGPPNAESWLRH